MIDLIDKTKILPYQYQYQHSISILQYQFAALLHISLPPEKKKKVWLAR